MVDSPKTNAYDRFTKDIAGHEMQVFVDDGVRRHVRFGRPGTYCMRFDLVTWPGHLCYTGDMGTFVFSRLPDMFEFFRGRVGHEIDFSYWAEKVLSADRDGVREFSNETFRETVTRELEEFIVDRCLSSDSAEGLRYEVKEMVLCHDQPEHDGVRAAIEFTWRNPVDNKPVIVFPDFWERDHREFTGRFVWCCYALRWAINTYDTAKAPTPAGASS